jgi:protoporphyrinogen oxidase
MKIPAGSGPFDSRSADSTAAAEEQRHPMKKVVAIGAGPAGLTAAYELVKNGVSVQVLEASPERVGGLSRTERYKGFAFDIGGHRFFSKSREIEELWTEILGSEMLERGRLSRIYYRGKFFDYPLKAMNVLRSLGLVNVLLALASFAWAKVRPIANPRSFEDWTINAFGRRLYKTFFETYTEKVWGIPCSEISADWAAQRIKGLSMLSLLKATLLPRRRKGRDQVIKTLIDTFRYPRHGPGQMWETVTRLVREGGGEVLLGVEASQILRANRGVTEVLGTRDGRVERFAGTHFLSSMPVRELIERLSPAAPPEVLAAARSLKYRDFLTVALIVDQEKVFPDNWIYIHDPGVRLGRIQNYKNWSPFMVPEARMTCLGLEYFCSEGDDLWTCADGDLIELGKKELSKIGLLDPARVTDGCVVRMKKAYPVYDERYAEHVAVIREFLEAEAPNLQLIGRNGMHKYNNQDHAMMTGLLAARNILGASFDLWKVNGDAEYQEEGDVTDSGRAVPRPIAPLPGRRVVPIGRPDDIHQ